MNSKKSKIFISIIVAILIVFVILFFVLRSKSAKIAFFDLPEKTVEILQEEILKTQIKSEFFVINENSREFTDFSSENAKKYDIVFIKDGFISKNLLKDSVKISSKIFENLPESIRDSERKFLPISIEPYILAYNSTLLDKIDVKMAQNFSDFTEILTKLKPYVFIPFAASGGNDEILLALISEIVESAGGYESYEKFVLLCQKNEFENILEEPLGNSEKRQFSLKTVLDLIKQWQNSGLIFSQWYNLQDLDIRFYIQDRQIGIYFSSLESHRNVPYLLAREFNTEKFPPFFMNENHAFLSETVGAIKFSRNSNSEKILEILTSDKTQEIISENTKNAPVSYRAQPFDKQSDDARYYSASAMYGQKAALYNAGFKNSEEAHIFAEEIRSYLRQK